MEEFTRVYAVVLMECRGHRITKHNDRVMKCRAAYGLSAYSVSRQMTLKGEKMSNCCIIEVLYPV
jgi:hypothetical protein